MVNGFPILPQRMDLLVHGREIDSLQEIARTDKKLVSHLLEPLPDSDIGRFRLLNTALFVDGLYLRVTTRVETPLVIVHVATADHPGTAAHSRVIIDASPGSSATIIEHHVQQGTDTPLCNSASLIKLERDAADRALPGVRHRSWNHPPGFARGAPAQGQPLPAVHHRARRRAHPVLARGRAGRARRGARQLFAPGRPRRAPRRLRERRQACREAHHEPPDDRGRSRAAPAASSSTARWWSMPARSKEPHSKQSCRGLLLSPTAEIDSRPQLEIHTDEVKCSHGATTGPVSIRICSSTCCREVWIATPRRVSWSMRSSPTCSPG